MFLICSASRICSFCLFSCFNIVVLSVRILRNCVVGHECFFKCPTLVWLNTRAASCWDRNPADFTSVGYLTPVLSSFSAKEFSAKEFFTLKLFFHIRYRITECSIYEKSFALYVAAGNSPHEGW